MAGKIIIANWKMKLGLGVSIDLAKEIASDLMLDKIGESEVVICPSFIAINEVGKILSPSKIKLGAQDVFWQENGAYTGEVSVEMLQELGCKYFIIGHSERRQYLGETNEMINKKARVILRSGEVPIVCVGETLEERRQGKKDYIIMHQVERALQDVKILDNQEIIIAYEPVWVIGTGRAVEPEEVKYVADLIRKIAQEHYSSKNSLMVIYGGSVDSSNVRAFSERGGVDGFLVGAASLDAREFMKMIDMVAN